MASTRSQDAVRNRGDATLGLRRLLPTLVPAVLLVMALLMPGQIFRQEQTASIVGLGPAAWPRAMLMAMAGLCVLWLIRDMWVLRGAGRMPSLVIAREEEPYAMGRALIGLGLIIAYGWLLPIVGFAVASALFIFIWCLLGGMRNPVVLVPVALGGTVAVLWLFMGLALMPLPRGYGPFDPFSIWLLQTTGIY